MRLFGKKPPFSKQLKITPPEPLPGRYGVAIASCVKNEGAYIADWVSFHRAVGIRHFYIYDDGSTDETVAILKNLLTADELTLMPWISRMTDVTTQQGLNAQVIAFAHAVLNFGSQYKWMAFIDVDEFLLPKTGRTVEEALVGAKGFPNISLPWHMFGTGGHKTRPEGSILTNFTRRARHPISKRKNATNFKCIIDPCEVSEVSVHLFGTEKFGELTANDAGQTATRRGRKREEFYSSQFLQLNHYYTKSEQELREKLARGPASPGTRDRYSARVLSALESIEADTIEDVAMVDFVHRHKINLS